MIYMHQGYFLWGEGHFPPGPWFAPPNILPNLICPPYKILKETQGITSNCTITCMLQLLDMFCFLA